MISTAHGLKFTEFKTRYHEDSIPDVQVSFANRPIRVPAEIDAISERINREIDRRN